ncbi:Asp-tRNA(Asn)/Glu-tRNA(Gln) amidotransferase subunit GatC [Candidatus Nomurabacteria bacterium]|nr:Asp-tRNA(Asn)/Glu-tRNA(Gln) amidotransferase subunit GatC [Candidatus Nomurabacteria bacterium]
MQKDDIKHLANLARLELTDEEIAKYTDDTTEILGFIDQIQEAQSDKDLSTIENAGVRNVFREDDDVQETGEFTEVLLKEAPDVKDSFVRVKPILNNND